MNIEIKTAYKVKVWGDKIEKGEGFRLKYKEWYEEDKGFFRINDKEDWQLLKKEEIYFNKSEAEEALRYTKKDQLDFYKRQAKEYNDKLIELQKNHSL